MITRSRLIFSEIFDTDKLVMVVVESLHCVEPYKLIKQGDSVFPKYLKDKTLVD